MTISPAIIDGFHFHCVAADEREEDNPIIVIGGNNGGIIYSTGVEEDETEFEYYDFSQATVPILTTINGIDCNQNTGLFVAVSDNGVILTTRDPSTWEWSLSGVTNHLYDVAWVADSTWIAVGSSGKILKSDDDGGTWTTIASGVSDQLNAVAVEGTTVVVVGADGTVLVSTDSGATFTDRTGDSGTTENLHAVCYGPANYWAIVGEGSTIVQWDVSGDTFAPGSADTTADFFGVAWVGVADGLLLAAGSGAITISSTNGLTWSAQESGSTSSQINAVEYLFSRFISVGNDQKICYSATGAGVRAYQTFKPISDTLRAGAFCQSGAYMNYGNISELVGGEWINYPTRIWSAVPSTVNDFDVESGAWDTDLPGDGAILDMASIEGGWIVARSDSVDLMTDGGSLQLPWSWNGNYGEGLRMISNLATFGGAAFGVCEDGLIYRADYNSIQRLPGFFDLTEFDDFTPGDEEVQISFDPQTQKLVIFRPASPHRLFFVDDQSGGVTEFELPTLTFGGADYEPYSVFIPKNETTGFRVGYATTDTQMTEVITLDFLYGDAPVGFDVTDGIGEKGWFSEIQTGCFRITSLGARGEAVDILLRTNADPDSSVRPVVAVAVKSEPEDDWVWSAVGTHPGTIAVDGSTDTATGTGTAWSNLIGAGTGASAAYDIPWLVEKLTRVYESDGVDENTLTYTKSGTRQITTSVQVGFDLYVEAPTLPYVRGEENDLIELSDGRLVVVDAVNSATDIDLASAPDDYSGAGTYVETKMIPAGDDEKGDGKLLFGFGEGFDQLMIKIVMVATAANDAQWAKITGIELGYRPTGPELKTDGG